MPIQDPIETNLGLKFQSEKLSRIIKECNDLDILKQIALELLKLTKAKSAVADWATRRAAEADFATISQKLYSKGFMNE